MKRRSKVDGKGKRNKPGRRKAAAPKGSDPAATGHETETARLTRERDEALEQQRATSDVLHAISNSPTDTASILNAIAESVARLLGVTDAEILTVEGDVLRAVAKHGSALQWPMGTARTLSRNWVTGRAVIDRTIVHVADLQAQDHEFSQGAAYARQYGHRTTLAVPLLREGSAIGAILIRRVEVRPFTNKQIELVTNFATQAVIAFENARLLTELRQRTDDLTESLEQQTATSEVLKVISSSPGELKSVFQAMLENAVRICQASFGVLFRFEDRAWRAASMHSVPPAFAEYWSRGPQRPGPRTALGLLAETRQTVHIADVTTEPAYIDREPIFVAAVNLGRFRTILTVPILRDNDLVGAFAIYRQEVSPFTDKQIELVRNFAAQAVIAIENARLLNELRQRTDDLTESLEQQTATSDVLRVISASPGDLDPVFHAMLENATHICQAKFGVLMLSEGDDYRVVAIRGAPPKAYVEERQRNPVIRPRPGTAFVRAVTTRSAVQIADIQVEADTSAATGSTGTQLAHLAGARTVVAVPMVRDEQVAGAILIFRQEVRPFTDKQVALVENFAAQAVIAIENTRLLNELRQSLRQQTATADVLKVISRSTFDLKSVLNTLIESAAQLCEADMASMARLIGANFDRFASYGYSSGFHEFLQSHPILPGRGSASGRAVAEGKTIHIPDVLADREYEYTEGQKVGGYRTMLGIPLIREGAAVGALVLGRSEPRPFTTQQIELAETFADQAVIAIENVRLFEAEQERTRELGKSLEELRTTQDRLVQTEKLASLGQLTAGIAHEIKNPLNFVNNFSSISTELIGELRDVLSGISIDPEARAELDDLADTLRGNLEKVVQHGKRADAIVKSMLLHSGEASGEHRSTDINALVDESLTRAYYNARAEQRGFTVKLEKAFDPAAGEANLFPREITRALLNLISNGFYAATKRHAETKGSDHEPTLTAATKNLGDRVEIRIRDNGNGIPADVREKMFDPFFTTKPTGEGTGLGLSISHDIVVKQHGGSIEVDSALGEFAEFRVILPRSPSR